MLTAKDCEAILKGKLRKKIDHNTYLSRRIGGYSITLYATDVITIYDDGRYVLNSGGYRTVTTKDRLNKYGPVRVHQSKHVWYAGDVPFEDGMTVTAPIK